MKTKILLGVSFLFYFAEAALSCPVWKVGKMYIVDEYDQPVTNAVVYRYLNTEDSFVMQKNFYDEEDEPDSHAYIFWEGGGYRYWDPEEEKKKPADKYLRIQAPGFADVIIKALDFDGNRDYDDLPVLRVRMYGRKYITRGDLVTLIDKYVCETELKVKDSLTIGFADYIQSIRSENAVETAGRNAAFVVKTYPNPVIDKLSIDIAEPVTRPYKATLTDIQGRNINEISLDEQHSILDMQWESKGMYYIRVYDPDGVMLYSLKFVKS